MRAPPTNTLLTAWVCGCVPRAPLHCVVVCRLPQSLRARVNLQCANADTYYSSRFNAHDLAPTVVKYQFWRADLRRFPPVLVGATVRVIQQRGGCVVARASINTAQSGAALRAAPRLRTAALGQHTHAGPRLVAHALRVGAGGTVGWPVTAPNRHAPTRRAGRWLRA